MNKGMDRLQNQDKPVGIPSDDDSTATEEVGVKSKVKFWDKIAEELEKRRRGKDAYMCYSRMGKPWRAEMKRRVAERSVEDMPIICDVTVADVDELPWLPGDETLDVVEVEKLMHGTPFDDEDGVPQSPAEEVEPNAPTPIEDDEPAEIQIEIPAEVPIEIPAEVPIEVPAEVPAEIPQEIEETPPADTMTAEERAAFELELRTKTLDCFNWYKRMGNPNRADMKRRIVDMEESCGIKAEDVDLLPWMASGKRLDFMGVNKLIKGK
jgi:hypothetical protein